MGRITGKILVVAGRDEGVGIAEALRMDEHAVTVAMSVSDAIYFMSSCKPQLIVSDGSLRGMVGHELVCELKATGLSGDTPVLFVRAFNTREELLSTVQELLDSGG